MNINAKSTEVNKYIYRLDSLVLNLGGLFLQWLFRQTYYVFRLIINQPFINLPTSAVN